MIIFTFHKIHKECNNAEKIHCTIDFNIPVFKWCQLIKFSAFIRLIKDCIRMLKSKSLTEVIHNIKNPSQLPSSEKDGRYVKRFGKI